MTVLAQNLVGGVLAGDATFSVGTVRRLVGVRVVATGDGVPDKITLRTLIAGHQFKIAIYTISGLNPLSPISVSGVHNTQAGADIEVTLTSSAAMVSGVEYGIVFIATNTGAIFSANNSLSVSRRNGQVLTSINDSFPDPFVYADASGVRLPTFIIESTTVSITDIDQAITGQTSTANFNAPLAATGFSITGDTITKIAAATEVDADSASFVMPQWVDLETCVALGDVIVTATDGTNTTADFASVLSMHYQHPDAELPVPFIYVTLTSVSAEALAVIPNLQVGAQVAFDEARCDVGLDGRVTFDSYYGQSALWYRNPDDKIARLVIIDTSGSAAVAPVMPEDRTVTVYEGATTLGTFPAASGTPPISYTHGGADAALFTINTTTAKVDPVGALTTGQSGVITVSATNSTGSDTQTINWSVITLPEPSDLPPSSLLGIGSGIGI